MAGKSTLNRLELSRSRSRRAITRSATMRRRSKRCSSICSWKRIKRRARADRARSGCHGRSAARPPGGAVLPRLLRLLLLSAALCLLRPASAGGQAAARQHRCRGRRDRGSRPHRRPDPRTLAPGTHLAAGRFRLCPRGADGLVRGKPRRLPVRPGQERPAGRAEIASELAAAAEDSQQ